MEKKKIKIQQLSLWNLIASRKARRSLASISFQSKRTVSIPFARKHPVVCGRWAPAACDAPNKLIRLLILCHRRMALSGCAPLLPPWLASYSRLKKEKKTNQHIYLILCPSLCSQHAYSRQRTSTSSSRGGRGRAGGPAGERSGGQGVTSLPTTFGELLLAPTKELARRGPAPCRRKRGSSGGGAATHTSRRRLLPTGGGGIPPARGFPPVPGVKSAEVEGTHRAAKPPPGTAALRSRPHAGAGGRRRSVPGQDALPTATSGSAAAAPAAAGTDRRPGRPPQPRRAFTGAGGDRPGKGVDVSPAGRDGASPAVAAAAGRAGGYRWVPVPGAGRRAVRALPPLRSVGRGAAARRAPPRAGRDRACRWPRSPVLCRRRSPLPPPTPILPQPPLPRAARRAVRAPRAIGSPHAPAPARARHWPPRHATGASGGRAAGRGGARGRGAGGRCGGGNGGREGGYGGGTPARAAP